MTKSQLSMTNSRGTDRRNLDTMDFAPVVIGHWELVIGHSIQISHDPFVSNLG